MTLSRKTAKNDALPKGWRRVKLGELCSDISYGYTATASSKPIGPKFLRITDIADGEMEDPNMTDTTENLGIYFRRLYIFFKRRLKHGL